MKERKRFMTKYGIHWFDSDYDEGAFEHPEYEIIEIDE